MATQMQNGLPTEAPSASAVAHRALQVRIHLKTSDSDIALPQETGAILVSTEVRRYQLSTLVNRLLETEKTIPLEFLVNGQYLRTSLDEFLTLHGISAETTLSIEYVKALVPPQHVASYEHDDWVSSVHVLSGSSDAAKWSNSHNAIQPRILSGSYDALLRVWNQSAEVVATGSGHAAAVKSAKFVTPTQIVSSSVDRTLRVWKFSEHEIGSASLTTLLELLGHDSSVDSIAVHGPSSRILSASSDGRIGFWSTRKSEAPAARETHVPSSNKRRKLAASSQTAPQRGYLLMLEGHQQATTDVCFDQNDATVAYSSSLDHAVRTWDLASGAAVDARTTAQSLLAICHLPQQSVLATGGAMRYISLVDPRASASTISVMTLRGHTNAVTSLARDPTSDHQLVSASNDGTCRIWDIRSARNDVGAEKVSENVFVIDRESTKGRPKAVQGDEPRVFSVCWDREVGIVSGGRDKLLQINKATAS